MVVPLVVARTATLTMLASVGRSWTLHDWPPLRLTRTPILGPLIPVLEVLPMPATTELKSCGSTARLAIESER